jgi:hypothetical protein
LLMDGLKLDCHVLIICCQRWYFFQVLKPLRPALALLYNGMIGIHLSFADRVSSLLPHWSKRGSRRWIMLLWQRQWTGGGPRHIASTFPMVRWLSHWRMLPCCLAFVLTGMLWLVT